MAIDLEDFASGDTDYIVKLNVNNGIIEAAINSLQAALSGGASSDPMLAMFFYGFFNNTTTLVGVGAYEPTQAAPTLTVAAGTVYRVASTEIVQALGSTALDFTGQPADTYYVDVDAAGTPSRTDTLSTSSLWSVVWNGSAFVGDPVRIAPAIFDAPEEDAARSSSSTSPAEDFETLDDRLESIEASILDSVSGAEFDVLEAEIDALKYKTVGITLDTTVGLQGFVQVPYGGTIVGWSVVGDASGDVEVDVLRRANAGAPPTAPVVPTHPTHVISASAPIEISGAQTAAGGASAVSTWTTSVAQWDVVGFYLVSMTTMTKATLWIRIQLS